MPPKLKKFKNRLDGFIFDDFPICQAMKKAEDECRSLAEPELREAFRIAEK